MKKIRLNRTNLSINKSYVAESLEMKLARMKSNKEPINAEAPLIYQNRNEGVDPMMDIRTDPWELHVENMHTYAEQKDLQRADKAKVIDLKTADATAEASGGSGEAQPK